MNFGKEIDYILENGEEVGAKEALTELFGEAILLKKKIHLLKMVRFYHLINNAIIDSKINYKSIKSIKIIESENQAEGPKPATVLFFDIIANTNNNLELTKISNIKKVVNMEIQGLGFIDLSKFELLDEIFSNGTLTIDYNKDQFKDRLI